MKSYKHWSVEQQRNFLFENDPTRHVDPVRVIQKSWMNNDVFSYQEGETPAISYFKNNVFYAMPLTINFLVHDFGHLLVEVERGNLDRLKKENFGYKTQTENGRFFFNIAQLLCEMRVIAYEWMLRRELLPEVYTEEYMWERIDKKSNELTWMSFCGKQEMFEYISSIIKSTDISHLKALWAKALSVCKE